MATNDRPTTVTAERQDTDAPVRDAVRVEDGQRTVVESNERGSPTPRVSESGPGLLPTQSLSRRTVASYRTYADAERAIDHLSDRKFPVHRTAIVGEGIAIVEQVTGRFGYWRAAFNGAISAGIAGAFFGFIFGLFDWITPVLSSLMLALYGLLYGAIIGAVLGLIFHAVSGGRRDFTSVSGIRAERYSVVVDQEVADEAAQILQSMR